jgi:hypothetical protein
MNKKNRRGGKHHPRYNKIRFQKIAGNILSIPVQTTDKSSEPPTCSSPKVSRITCLPSHSYSFPFYVNGTIGCPNMESCLLHPKIRFISIAKSSLIFIRKKDLWSHCIEMQLQQLNPLYHYPSGNRFWIKIHPRGSFVLWNAFCKICQTGELSACASAEIIAYMFTVHLGNPNRFIFCSSAFHHHLEHVLAKSLSLSVQDLYTLLLLDRTREVYEESELLQLA